MNKIFWLSFAGEGESGKFLGVVIVEAEDFLSAVHMTHLLGISPGGQVWGMEIPDDAEINYPRNELLSKEFLTQHGERSLREMPEDERDFWLNSLGAKKDG